MLAGWTRQPGVAVAEGSGSSERRRRRVVAAAWPREPLASTGCFGGAPMRCLPVGNPSVLGLRAFVVEADRSPRPRVDVREN